MQRNVPRGSTSPVAGGNAKKGSLNPYNGKTSTQQGRGAPQARRGMVALSNVLAVAALVVTYGPAAYFHYLDEKEENEFSVRKLLRFTNMTQATMPLQVHSLSEYGMNSAGNPTYFQSSPRNRKTNKTIVLDNIDHSHSTSLRSQSTENAVGNKGKKNYTSSDKDHPIIMKKRELVDMSILNQNLPFDNPDGGTWKQGWNVQPVQGNITVFVIPHSHCDPGWIKTFDEYFRTQTKNILTTVYEALMKDERRTFIWAEISYFEWWWREQRDKVKDDMRVLIRKKQFEFVTGGWVQPDEANTERFAIEVQLQEGHDWLNKTFGGEVIPKYGWSIDPFGYSPTMAAVLHDYGFKGMLIQRVHYALKKEFAKKQQLEFDWRQTWDDEEGTNDIFTHLMPFYSYDTPHTCGPEPAVCCQFDFARLNNKFGGCPWRKPPQEISPKNVEERSRTIIDQYRKKAALYRSNIVMAPLGDDFRYQSLDEAEKQYTNYQKIFDYANEHMDGVSIRFGTLSDYFEAVRGKFTPPLLKGSFFTYADRDEDYWSGYFTSRIFDKALDRRLEAALYAAMTMGATREEMQAPRRALSLFQHHDGVTGTAKNHVVEDYALRMYEGIKIVQAWMSGRLDKDVVGNETKPTPCWAQEKPRTLGSNICDPEKPVYMYNPLNTPQKWCGNMVARRETSEGRLTCDVKPLGESLLRFDAKTGMLTHPVREEWMVWKVRKGGAYLFFPDTLSSFAGDLAVEDGGYKVYTPSWSRTIVEHEPGVVDFFFKTNLQARNEEWFVRFSSDVHNGGVFHTDLNGFDFDTHHFRSDLPVQAQVFPMPTLASIEDNSTRFTVISEHAQGTASLQDGNIDVWLDRRLGQDDARGLNQGVIDNVPIRTRLRVVMESEFSPTTNADFKPTPRCQRLWDEVNHPLELFGTPLLSSSPHRSDDVPGVSRLQNERIVHEHNRKEEDGGNNRVRRQIKKPKRPRH